MGSTNSVVSVQAEYGKNGSRNGRETVCNVCDCGCGQPLVRYVDDGEICREQSALARVAQVAPEEYANLLATMPDAMVQMFEQDGVTPAEGLALMLYENATEAPPSLLDMFGSFMLDDDESPEAPMIHMTVRGDAELLALLGMDPATPTGPVVRYMTAKPGSPEEEAALTELALLLGDDPTEMLARQNEMRRMFGIDPTPTETESAGSHQELVDRFMTAEPGSPEEEAALVALAESVGIDADTARSAFADHMRDRDL